MTSLLLLRTLPLLRNGFLNHRHQVGIVAAGLLSQRRRLLCSLADKPQLYEDGDSTAERFGAGMNTTSPVGDNNLRYEDPDYRKWKNLEAEILRDIEPIALLAKEILYSDRYLDGERLEFEDEKIVIEKLLAYHPYSKDKIGCGLDFIMVRISSDAVIKPTTSHGRGHMEQRQADKTEQSKSTLRRPSQSQVTKELEPRTNIGVPQVMMRRIKTSLRTVLFFLHCGYIPIGFPGKVLTRQQLIGAQETKANCSSLTTTWITSSPQLENTSKWNQPSIRSHEGDIKFTSHVNPDLTCLDLRALFEGFRSYHKELSYKSTWYVFLIHQRSSGNWIRTKPKSDEKVIQFLNRWILLLPYLAPYGFMGLQTYQWRPRDFNTDLEASQKVLQCSSTQRIRRILLHIDLPYLDTRSIKSQRLYFPHSC